MFPVDVEGWKPVLVMYDVGRLTQSRFILGYLPYLTFQYVNYLIMLGADTSKHDELSVRMI